MRKIVIAATVTSAFLTTPAFSGGAGFAAFVDGFSKGMRQRQEGDLIEAETKRIQLETDRMKRDKSEENDSQKNFALKDFWSKWKPKSTAPLTPIGKRQRPSDKPDEWSDDGLTLSSARLISADIIEVYRVSDLSPGLAKRLQAGSTVDRMAVDCRKGTVTGFEIALFQLSNGLGSPVNYSPVFSILTKPFDSPWVDIVYEKSCQQLGEKKQEETKDFDALQNAIDRNPRLKLWQETNVRLWDRAVEVDTILQNLPETKNLSLDDRFARVVRFVESEASSVKP